MKRTATIRLSNFPPDVSLGTICEALAEFLLQFSPPISLERLLLSDNNLTTLSPEIELLCGICMRYLDLHNNKFSTFPSVIGNCCPRLEGLDLSLNCLSILPRGAFANFPDLKVLLIKNNEFNYIPPFLGEMINLEAIAVSENPLILPTLDVIKLMPGGTNDLKAYLLSNSAVLDQHIHHQAAFTLRAPSTPSVARTRSLSDTRTKSLKASRRMGLIINSNKTTPDDAPRTLSSLASSIDSFTPSKPERKLLLPDNDDTGMANILERKEASFQLELPTGTSTYTTSTANHSRSSSPSGTNLASVSSRSATKSRSRSNTLKEINAMLENSELVDSDQKSGAYFRRLSTLQERPFDEAFRASQEELVANSREEDHQKRTNLKQNQENSPLKPSSRKTSLSNHAPSDQFAALLATQSHSEPHSFDLSTVLKVARKVLYSFSEVHSSIKRFTGFCSDRRVTLKVVPLLHTTKGNIDTLVETMESAEDNGENQEAIMNAVQSCITSFKQIFEIVTENFPSFVAKIDVCFMRMVYLTLYGSLNEVQNAYRLLHPLGFSARMPAVLARNQSGLALSTLDPKIKHSHSIVAVEDSTLNIADQGHTVGETDPLSAEDIDENLYQCIDLATTNAQIVFSELTKAIGKSAIASANPSGNQINSTVSTKFKELTNVCITSMEITKRLISKLSSIRTNQSQAMRRLFWDDTNLFLKAILQTFSSVKGIMKDAPILNEVRQSMATLTKTTKDLTIYLEASSYKSMSDVMNSATHLQASLISATPTPTVASALAMFHSSSAVNLPQLGGTLVRTPLVATVGAAAAQAILPLSESSHAAVGSSAGNAPSGISIPPLVSTDVLNTGLHTAPVQSMEQYYAKNVNPFDRL